MAMAIVTMDIPIPTISKIKQTGLLVIRFFPISLVILTPTINYCI